jgi:mono/diheme cytochrome c family protein
MSWPRLVALGFAAAFAGALAASAAESGRPATPDEIRLWDIDVRPDGTGLPVGSGSVARGQQVYADNCAACHGDRGQGGIADRLSGGQGTLASDNPVKTVGSFWPYATTLFDYVRRAMPYPAPQTLSDDDTYAVVAFILSLNGTVPADATLNRSNLPSIRMPNRNGFVPDEEFRVIHNSRQQLPRGTP